MAKTKKVGDSSMPRHSDEGPPGKKQRSKARRNRGKGHK